MKKVVVISTIVMALVATTSPALAQSGFRDATLTAQSAACGQVTVTLTNPYGFNLEADFGYGDPTQVRPYSDLVIRQGPYKDDTFGLYYEAPNGTSFGVTNGTGSATLALPEDVEGGLATVTYRVKAGGEQQAYILPQTIQVVTNCFVDPETREDCKDGSWQLYGFRNQGQCIRFVNTGQDSRV